MNNKLKGFTLIEVIISVALLSILSLGLMKSLLSISSIFSEQKIRKEMINSGEEAVERTLCGLKYDSSDFIININTTDVWEKIKRIDVEVHSEETDYEVKFSIYKEKEN